MSGEVNAVAPATISERPVPFVNNEGEEQTDLCSAGETEWRKHEEPRAAGSCCIQCVCVCVCVCLCVCVCVGVMCGYGGCVYV